MSWVGIRLYQAVSSPSPKRGIAIALEARAGMSVMGRLCHVCDYLGCLSKEYHGLMGQESE